MSKLLEQLKKRRNDLGLKQNDMMLRIGISRQQYQRLESKGNPRLDTLELVAKGLKSELVLIPQEKLVAVKSILAGNEYPLTAQKKADTIKDEENALANNPWQGQLGEDD